MRELVWLKEIRGEIAENLHPARVAVVDREGRLLFSAGNHEQITYYRSASKPLQALPVLVRGLDQRYHFTQEETAMLAGSHMGEPAHVERILSMLQKAGFQENDMVMAPAYPDHFPALADILRQGLPPRKAMHNCSGKHVGLMMLARDCGDTLPYFRLASNAQQEVLKAIATIAEWPSEQIQTGVDGCGVPVFALPLTNIAISMRNLACPAQLPDTALALAATEMCRAMAAYPFAIRGTGSLCTLLNSHSDLVAKSGRSGVYGVGIKSREIGIAFKFEDGNQEHYPQLLKSIFERIDYIQPQLFRDLEAMDDRRFFSDTGEPAGTVKVVLPVLDECDGNER